VVTRYRIYLEDRLLAPGTINVRLAAVRRLAYEAADTGLLSPDLAAGIRRVKGAKKLGMRLGNWLTVEEARALWQLPSMHTVKGRRDRAILAVLLGCGLRRRQLIDLTVDHIQRREDHWAIVDLVGKGGHIRTVPMPDWVKQALDNWLDTAQIAHGKIFRCVCRTGVVWGNEDHRKSGLAHCEAIRGEARRFKARATRSQKVVCSVLSRFGRRIGANPIPTRACICADDGKISWMQAAIPARGE
jgi:integrase